jgi:hypothetical protein
VSQKQQRDKYRQRILSAFEPNYHSDHGVPIYVFHGHNETELTGSSSSELKEAFPAGRFRPICKIQAKRGAASTAVADVIKSPEWWHSTKIIQAFDSVLQDKVHQFSSFFSLPELCARICSSRNPLCFNVSVHLDPSDAHLNYLLLNNLFSYPFGNVLLRLWMLEMIWKQRLVVCLGD